MKQSFGCTLNDGDEQKSCEKEDWCNMIISITDNGIGMSEEFQSVFLKLLKENVTLHPVILRAAASEWALPKSL
ncbi:hypothetical protein [Coprococcus comes]|uniref:hypothetical protein n=1 Tax=Coprococcus comes TaxID=410072 RepID=UPI002ED4A1DE